MRRYSSLVAAGFLGAIIGLCVGFVQFSVTTRDPHPKPPPHLSLRVCSLEELDKGEYHEPPRGTIVVVLDDGRDAPPGWVECNGQNLTADQHAELFADTGFNGQKAVTLPSLPMVHIMCVSHPPLKSETMPFLMLIQTRAEPPLFWRKLRMLIRTD
jgi:hypothetical protein